MKRGIFYFISILMLISCVAKNQPATPYSAPDYFILLDDIRLMETDHLGNLYVVDDNDRLSKFDTTGLMTYSIVNNDLGDIHSIDAGNPFKIMIFYRDQQTILLIDRTLSEIQRIRLAEWKLQDVTAASLSPDNAIWVFDGTNRVLIKMSDSGIPILTSDPMDILGPPSARPDFIDDIDHYLLVHESGKQVAVFNDFGSYLHSLPIVENWFSITGDKIAVQKDDIIQLYSLPSGEESASLRLTEKLVGKKVLYYDNRFIAADEKGIYLVQVLEP